MPQGDGGLLRGGAATGIPFVDSFFYGDSDTHPEDMTANKGHNVYYALPLILGLIGLFFQIGRGRRGVESFWVTFMLFFMTGIAIVLYLNQYPGQPRERDYAYVGSFYAFAIWVGFGVAAIATTASRYLSKQPAKKTSDEDAPCHHLYGCCGCRFAGAPAHPHTDGRAELGRPRPLGAYRRQRHGPQLPREL